MLQINRLDSADTDFAARLNQFIKAAELDRELQAQVQKIVQRVREEGDQALLEYTRSLDNFSPLDGTALRISEEQFSDAQKNTSDATLTALKKAAERIRQYAERQKTPAWDWEEDGIRVGQRITPIASVGLYIPGGKAVYPSSVLMTAILAQVAEVPRIVAVSSSPGGNPNPVVLVALQLCGVDEVYMIGGAQAIAALAYGTETITPVDKIVGPGNRYVTEAKRQVFGQVGIDMIAGPSEIVIIADGSGDISWLAADMLSQAEHDEQARSILISDDDHCIDAAIDEMGKLVATTPRAKIIRQSLCDQGLIVKVRDLDEAAEIVNKIAPEHLELMVADTASLLPKIRNAGAIFLGYYACEVLGDYCAGPSHVLPTGSAARFSSPLGIDDFQKRSSIVDCTAQGAAKLSPVAQRIAEDEGLFAHADSARRRFAPSGS